MEFWRNMPEALPEDRTLWVGNLSDDVTEELLWELFIQAGPLKRIALPRDENGQGKRFAFVEFTHQVSVPYAKDLMDGIRVNRRPLRCQFRGNSCHGSERVEVEQFLCGEELPEVFKGVRHKERDNAWQRTVSQPAAGHSRQQQQPAAAATAATMYQQFMSNSQPIMPQYNMNMQQQQLMQGNSNYNPYFAHQQVNPQLVNFVQRAMAMNQQQQQYGQGSNYGYHQNSRR